MKLRLVFPTIAAALVGFFLALLFPSAAFAADPLYTPPPRPAKMELGITPATLALYDTPNPTFPEMRSARTGFSNAAWGDVAFRESMIPSIQWPGPRQQMQVEFSDPFIHTDGKLSFKWFTTRLPDYRDQTPIWNFRLAPSFVYCQATEWALPSSQTKFAWSASGQSIGPGQTRDGGDYVAPPLAIVQNVYGTCPFIARIEYIIVASEAANGTGTGVLQGSPLTRAPWVPTAANPMTITQNWRAVDFVNGLDRPQDAADYDLCTNGTKDNFSSECPYVEGVPEKWQQDELLTNACAGAPTPEWLNFTWLPRFLNHYSRCLWVPSAGWDFTAVDAALAANPVWATADDFASAVSAVDWNDGCGVLLAVPPPLELSINSCAWEFAAPIKQFIYFSLLFFLSVWTLKTVINITSRSFKTGDLDDLVS